MCEYQSFKRQTLSIYSREQAVINMIRTYKAENKKSRNATFTPSLLRLSVLMLPVRMESDFLFQHWTDFALLKLLSAPPTPKSEEIVCPDLGAYFKG